MERLLRLRFQEVAPEIVERVDAASPEELERWTERILTETSPEDVLAG